MIPWSSSVHWPPTVSQGLLGVCVGLDGAERRHPTVLARDMTSLDLLCNGRSLLCFAPPFGPAHLEAIALCRQMWEAGTAASDGPIYPVPGAVNRPRPAAEHSPRLALDLTDGGRRRPSGADRGGRLPAPARPGPRRLPRGAPVSLDAVELAHAPVTATETTAVTGRHLPALNGLRGVAVLGVVAYHLQLGWASGGYLGVDLFFVLSGFLISTLLLEEWAGSGRINLGAFWARRAKRLLPALFLVVAALALYLIFNAIFGAPGANGLVDLAGLRGDAIWTLLYANNWHLVYAHQSYFAQFSTPSPLQHTWSLAIEEQFYLVWPLVLLLLLRVARGAWRRTGLIITVTLGVLSSVLMAVLFNPGVDPSRIYYGTDTRLFDLMAGATLAFVAASRPQPSRRSRRTLHSVGPLAAIALAVFWVTSGTPGGLPRNFMFEGGFLLCAGLAALVVADARLVQPGRFARLLAARPLHFLGTISYGIYLWHWPVIVYLTGQRTGLSQWPLDLLRIAVTLALATASYYLVERPVRLAHLHGWVRWSVAPVAGVATAVIIVVATFPAVADPSAVARTSHLAAQTAQTAQSRPDRARRRWVPGPGADPSHHRADRGRPAARHAPGRLGDARRLVRRSPQPSSATGEATVATRTIDGFGLTTALELAHLHSQSDPARRRRRSSWPPGAGTSSDRPRPTPSTNRPSTRSSCAGPSPRC